LFWPDKHPDLNFEGHKKPNWLTERPLLFTKTNIIECANLMPKCR